MQIEIIVDMLILSETFKLSIDKKRSIDDCVKIRGACMKRYILKNIGVCFGDRVCDGACRLSK